MIRVGQVSAAAEACNYSAVIVVSGSLVLDSDASVKQLQIGGILAVSDWLWSTFLPTAMLYVIPWVTHVTCYGKKIHQNGTELLVVCPSYNIGRQYCTCSDASQLIRRLET